MRSYRYRALVLENKRNINNDLAVVASHIPGRAIHNNDADSNPNLSSTFKGLLNKLVDYNATQDINRTGQVNILCK